MKKGVLSFAVYGALAFCICVGFATDCYASDEYISFEQLMKDAESSDAADLIYKRIRFKGQFNDFGDVYAPFFTCFSSTNFMNFSAWEFEERLWEKEQYHKLFPYLFVMKTNYKMVNTLASFKQYTRFEAEGEVRGVFQGKPWIKVVKLKKVCGRFSQESIKHMNHGYIEKEKNNVMNTAIEFCSAYQKTLPVYAKALIRKEEGTALFLLGDYANARTCLREAYNYYGSDDPEVMELLQDAITITKYNLGYPKSEVKEEVVEEPPQAEEPVEIVEEVEEKAEEVETPDTEEKVEVEEKPPVDEPEKAEEPKKEKTEENGK